MCCDKHFRVFFLLIGMRFQHNSYRIYQNNHVKNYLTKMRLIISELFQVQVSEKNKF